MPPVRRFFAVYIMLSALAVQSLVTGCSAVMIDNDSPPEEQYAEGERLLNKDRYLEAVERFRILRSRYPYSKFAALASLRIGDTHFKEEAFVEAASAYRIFRELYPRHEMAPYALFRMGESYYNLLPSTIDRDLEPAQSAIDAYNQLMREHPGSTHQAEAEKRVKELRGKLAEKEAYVGDYYFKRELYQAAAGRFSYLLQNFPEAGNNEEVLYKLAYSFERTGDLRRAVQALDLLDQDFPKGRRLSDRNALRKRIAATTGSSR